MTEKEVLASPRPDAPVVFSVRAKFWTGLILGSLLGVFLGFNLGFFSAGYLYVSLNKGRSLPRLSDVQTGVGSLPSPKLAPPDGRNSSFDHGLHLLSRAGKPYSLDASRGKVLFINLWASTCGPCLREMPAIESLYRTFRDDPRIEFLAISRDEPARLQQYLGGHTLAVPIYTFVPGEDIPGSGSAVPVTYVIDRSGKVLLHATGAANWADPSFLAFLRSTITASGS